MSGNAAKADQTKSSKYAEIAKAANSHRGVQDILESDDDDETPGPGAHWNAGMSAFVPPVKPRRFQNFGSTVVDRFADNYGGVAKAVGTENVGPGTYHQDSKANALKIGGRKALVPENVGFTTGSNRFKEVD